MTKAWWKEAVIYQIYPRSFKDSNGDGIGDLRGIIQKADYLQGLGIDVVWLCPVYQSPNDDNGYDISNYYEIHPEFGTMDDFDELLDALHARQIRLIMDLVVNHTSDEHRWFRESRKSMDNPYRDYYIWKDGRNGGPPNNWTSFFSGSAWQLDEATGQYYLHLFTRKQPDLNWENPIVRKEVKDIIRYWCDKGIDGFRMDVIPLISKRLDFADTTQPTFIQTVEKVYSNGPRVHEYINEIYEDVLQHYDVMTVGEGPGISKEVGLDYVGEGRRELNMIFHLDHMFLGFGKKGRFDQVPYSLADVKRIYNEWDEAMGQSGWISIFMDNHDFPRMVSRFGDDDRYRKESATLLATMILTLRGTPCIYQGSEIGMTNIQLGSRSNFRDVEAHNYLDQVERDGGNIDEAIQRVDLYGRDNVRTPMQWNDQPNAGFTSGEPWIMVHPNFEKVNVEQAASDENSILTFYKQLLVFRKSHAVFVYGHYKEVKTAFHDVFYYRRWNDEEEFRILLNFSNQIKEFDSFRELSGATMILTNYPDHEQPRLRPWEARIYRMK